MMNKIAIRVDDICPTMNWKNFERLVLLFDKYNIKPLLGVVPNNLDSTLMIDKEREDFFKVIKSLQEDGYSIAIHGYDHVQRNNFGGMLKTNRKSEVVGFSIEEQEQHIKKGLNTLEKHDIYTNIYMPPFHSYDENTVIAAYNSGIKYFTDGLTTYNYIWHKIIFIPCRRSLCYVNKLRGIQTLCLHINKWEDEQFKLLEDIIEKGRNCFVDFDNLKFQATKKYSKNKERILILLRKIIRFIK